MKPYQARVEETFKAFGGTRIVAGGRVDVLEGAAPSGKVVIVQFPDMAAARAWHDSPAYKAILGHRLITPLDAPQDFLSEAAREREVQAAAQDSPLMRALGLAHHWQRLLDEERAASLAEIAEAEGMDVTQVRRLLRLTLLAPDLVEQLVGAKNITLEQVVRRSCPFDWGEQLHVIVVAGLN